MSWFRLPKSLFVNTSLILAFGLIVYSALSIALILHFVLQPMASRATEDMAAFISVVSESWADLSEQDRVQFQRHLREHHQLFITTDPVKVTEIKEYHPYIPLLERALLRHAGQKVVIKQNINGPCCFWVDLQQGEHIITIGFLHERFGPRLPIALIGILTSGCLLILVASMFLVRRISNHVKKLSTAANHFGMGDFSTRIPETGPEELASLAHSFNVMAEELTQLMTNRTILFGGISHDLRTPITRMQIALELLEDKNCNLINGLKNDLNEMERLIQQALELVKGLDKHPPTEIDLDLLLDKIVKDYKRQQHTIHWHKESCGICKLEVDVLRRVLTNLLDNAFRYGGNEAIELSCIKMNKNWVIRIKDQGPGIPKDKIEAVFQPFFRLDNSRSKKTGGSGLGLAIVRQLCDIHGWKIQLFPGKVKGLEACLIIPINK